jgi:hypothetical protein
MNRNLRLGSMLQMRQGSQEYVVAIYINVRALYLGYNDSHHWLDYVICHIAWQSGARVEIIVYVTHSLVVELSITVVHNTLSIYLDVDNGLAANCLIVSKISLQFTRLWRDNTSIK